MESPIPQQSETPSRRMRAQAALWVTELHGPDRDSTLEAAVRRWIEEDPRHAVAFELATDAWQRSGNLPAQLTSTERGSGKANSNTRRAVLAGVAAVIVAVVGVIFWARGDTLTTGPGEQRTIELADGTDVSLNANSRIKVRFDDHVREATLLKGEAFFNVIKHQPTPFVVIVGERKVIAMGTSFEVRRDDPNAAAFAVTLVEGRVAIEPISGPDILPADPKSGVKLLNPGERLRFDGVSTEKVDLPPIEKVTAWQRGQLIFDDTSLSEAAAEFNRYSPNAITVEGPAAGKLRVGGVFRIGDPSSFAQAMANAYHLKIAERGKRIILSEQGADAR